MRYAQYKLEIRVLRINLERFTNIAVGFENVSKTSTRESVDSIITLKVAQSKEERVSYPMSFDSAFTKEGIRFILIFFGIWTGGKRLEK